MLTADNAVREILSRVNPLASTEVPILDALGLVLSTGITSPIDFPHWDNSAMDGYAARSADLQGTMPVTLTIVEEIAAGAFPTRDIGEGECARIFTGAPAPKGADCVIRQEDTQLVDNRSVRIDNARDAGRNIRRRGEDFTRGTTVLEYGTTIGPSQLGVLASLAMATVPVHRKPTVAILASGNEIADVSEKEEILAGRKIASSNTYTLRALIQQAGATPRNLGIAKDDPADFHRRLQHAYDADLIITTAGVSVGEHDYLHQVMDELDLERVFRRLKLRPGAPTGFGFIGKLGNKPWLGLPGNPVSTMVTFELFGRPAIRRLLGHTKPFRQTVPVVSGEEIKLGPELRHFLRVTLSAGDEHPIARLTGAQGSGILTSMAKADALLVVPEDMPVVKEGEVLHAIVLDDPRHVEDVPW
jgi:molybdopterin molybdotransferase